MDKEIAKELLEITKDKPHKIRIGEIRDIDYIEVAKKYKEFFIKSDEAIFSRNMLNNFWELETKSQFRTGVEKIKSSLFFNNGLKAFRKKYKLDYPYAQGKEIGLLPNTTTTGKLYELGVEEDLIKLPPNYIESGGYIRYQAQNKDYYPLYYGIFKALFFTENNQLQLDELTHIVNTEGMSFSPKLNFPLDEKTIYNEVTKHNNYFEFVEKAPLSSNFNGTIKLNNFLDEIIEHFDRERFDYTEIENFNAESGIVAVIFKGKEFPLIDAVEYVNIRDIISINTIENIKEQISLFFNQKEIIPHYLNTVINEVVDLSNDTDGIEKINKWTKENILLSFYPLTIEEAKFYKFCLNFKLSPILETDSIFENIYRNTIIEKQKQFAKKLEAKNE